MFSFLLSFPQRMPYKERDKWISKLWTWLQSDAAKKHVASLDSMIDKVKKDGVMEKLTSQSDRIISSCWTYYNNENRLPSLLEIEQNVMPRLNEAENKDRNSLEQLSCAELYNRLQKLLPEEKNAKWYYPDRDEKPNPPLPRHLGHIRWALLNKKDRGECIRSGIEAFKKEKLSRVRVEILRVIGDMLLRAKEDTADARTIKGFLESVKAGKDYHWTVNALAECILHAGCPTLPPLPTNHQGELRNRTETHRKQKATSATLP